CARKNYDDSCCWFAYW
nr:immunoglobulin heavy chain junction region [Mus musculus]